MTRVDHWVHSETLTDYSGVQNNQIIISRIDPEIYKFTSCTLGAFRSNSHFLQTGPKTFDFFFECGKFCWESANLWRTPMACAVRSKIENRDPKLNKNALVHKNVLRTPSLFFVDHVCNLKTVKPIAISP